MELSALGGGQVLCGVGYGSPMNGVPTTQGRPWVRFWGWGLSVDRIADMEVQQRTSAEPFRHALRHQVRAARA